LDLQQTAMDSLGRIGTPTVPELVAMLRDLDPRQRANPARVLARIGPEAAAVPALTSALSDLDEIVQQSAARSLGHVGPAAQLWQLVASKSRESGDRM
jgi:HEAT repeat protein